MIGYSIHSQSARSIQSLLNSVLFPEKIAWSVETNTDFPKRLGRVRK